MRYFINFIINYIKFKVLYFLKEGKIHEPEIFEAVMKGLIKHYLFLDTTLTHQILLLTLPITLELEKEIIPTDSTYI